MDPQRLDRIATILGTETRPRRRMLRALAGGAVAAAVARLGWASSAVAGCATVGHRCATRGDCCAGARCRNGKCRCKSGRPTCGKTCCLPGATCGLLPAPPYNPVCYNGDEQPGDPCNPAKPGYCSSGICRCYEGSCFCREVLCRNTGDNCSAAYQCCQGYCNFGSFRCDT